MARINPQPDPQRPQDAPEEIPSAIPDADKDGYDADFNGLHDKDEDGKKKDTKDQQYDGSAVNEKEEPEDDTKCPHCKEDITLDQIKAITTIDAKNETLVSKILEYLNLYKADHKIDTCVRKAHFIAQALHESGSFTVLEEDLNYRPSSLLSYFKKDEYIALTDSNLTKYKDYFSVAPPKAAKGAKDTKDAKPAAPAADQYKDYSLNPAYIYGNTNKETQTTLTSSDGKSKIEIDLKKHKADERVVGNRKYGGRDGNDKNSDDGYNFRGHGIIQLTHKPAYESFTAFAKSTGFNKEKSTIDFTESKDEKGVKTCNSDLLSDKKDPKYAVQSAVWLWSTYKISSKLEVKSDEENFAGITNVINGGNTGTKDRYDKLLKGREQLKVYDHYKYLLENQKDEKKKTKLKAALKQMASSQTVYAFNRNTKKFDVNGITVDSDPKGQEILDEFGGDAAGDKKTDKPADKKTDAPAKPAPGKPAPKK
ncbi:glycoside hydrolase family 19 protein [Chitinophaga flava]|uniref:Glycoside hydrolase family 19 catalytic domain-containing protein n=1 Tax=Chitinophaga flava TaxID=2259036 RepID=A0A365XXD7_9BACT|nr:hypothetical protein [Chitinophaga flava]RBL90671.1 hypothetical protein DF182_29930 [Chitinophaga flava]